MDELTNAICQAHEIYNETITGHTSSLLEDEGRSAVRNLLFDSGVESEKDVNQYILLLKKIEKILKKERENYWRQNNREYQSNSS